jgi:hypothetical protein
VLYWAWKNLKRLYPDVEYAGLYHYRRYFALDKKFGVHLFCTKLPSQKAAGDLIKKYLKKHQIILSKKRTWRYSIRRDFCKDMGVVYQALKQVVHEIHPEYDRVFRKTFEFSNKISSYNMFIAKYDFLDKYCAWLFPVLFEVERRINLENSNEDGQRLIGIICEALLNVYVYHNKIRILYKPIYVLVGRKPKFYKTMLYRLWTVIENFFYYIYIRPSDFLLEMMGNVIDRP